MSTSLVIRVLVAATALSVAPAIASAQAPQTKPCKDGTTSSRSTFACWGHGGVDTTHHRPAEPVVQAGAPRVAHAKPTARKESKASAHHAKVEHREAHAGKKKPDVRHKKEHGHDGKKAKKRADDSRLPVPKHPNGRPF